jgi:hypothetical protein
VNRRHPRNLRIFLYPGISVILQDAQLVTPDGRSARPKVNLRNPRNLRIFLYPRNPVAEYRRKGRIAPRFAVA